MKRLSASLSAVAVVLVTLVGAGVAGAADREPAVVPARAGTRCLADPATMRREHMNLLKHQRDDTVRAGVRGTGASLRSCIDCHASAQTHSVAQSEADFCVACHRYAAVQIDCFQCHNPRASTATTSVRSLASPVATAASAPVKP